MTEAMGPEHKPSVVVTVGDLAALRRLLPTCLDHDVLLVELEVVGPELSVEIFVQEGRVVFASATGNIDAATPDERDELERRVRAAVDVDVRAKEWSA